MSNEDKVEGLIDYILDLQDVLSDFLSDQYVVHENHRDERGVNVTDIYCSKCKAHVNMWELENCYSSQYEGSPDYVNSGVWHKRYCILYKIRDRRNKYEC